MSLPPNATLGQAILANLCQTFVQYKTLADGALAQLTPSEWLYCPALGSNSAAVIVQHLVGNLRSRFTDFLTTDGEKPTRSRDQEFEQPTSNTAIYVPALQRQWEETWNILLDLLNTLQPKDLLRTITIRGEAHSVLEALQRQVAHYSSHVGQLVFLAKLIRGEEWQNLSVPRGQSENFTQQVRSWANPTQDSAV